jgi:hypothetical protein
LAMASPRNADHSILQATRSSPLNIANRTALGLASSNSPMDQGKGRPETLRAQQTLTIQIHPLDLLTLRAASAQVGLLSIRPIAIFLRHLQQSLFRPRHAGQSSLRSGKPLQWSQSVGHGTTITRSHSAH